MNSRELVFESLGHRTPPRIPWTLYVAKPLADKLAACWGPRSHWPCPPDDLVRVLWEVEADEVTSNGFKDPFGCPWRRDTGGYIFINSPLSEPNAAKIPHIDLVTQTDLDRIFEARTHGPDQFIFYQFTCTFGERLWCLRGLEQALMDFYLEPDFVHAALDKLLDMHLEALDKILPLPVDGVTIGDDFGTQRGLMISREVFRKFFKPRLAILYDKIRAAGKVVGHHSCGNNTDLMADFVDLGVQVFHPLQPEAMDITAVKREFGKHLTFRGGIGVQGPIVFGTPAEAKCEVRRAVEVLCPEGGYLLETAKPLPEETPLENAVAVIEEMVRVMKYEF